MEKNKNEDKQQWQTTGEKEKELNIVQVVI